MKDHSCYRILLEKLDDGGYVATVPEIPGFVTNGTDADHTLEIARDALKFYIERMERLDSATNDVNGDGDSCIKVEQKMMN